MAQPFSSPPSDYLPIEDYGIIGNLHTTALVSRCGSIDYCCAPRYDSPTIFAKILDADRGGYWSITPDGAADTIRYKQIYLPNTCILMTRMLSEAGISELTDFMPVVEREGELGITLYRRLRAVTGRQNFRMRFLPRAAYGARNFSLASVPGGYRMEDPEAEVDSLILETDLPLQAFGEGGLEATFTLEAGEEVCFLLRSTEVQASCSDILPAFRETHRFWHEWADRCNYDGPWKSAVLRSALTLKLLTSLRYGAPIAAATFSLPETIGGTRNWDYRYTWIRDAAFTMYAFLRLGYQDEAQGFMTWIEQICDDQELQLLYTVDGKTELTERTLDHLNGYRDSQPVRVGNGAHDQLQLDIYGELIDTIYLFHRAGGSVTYAFWQRIVRLVEYVLENWRRPDHGIWEVRNEQRRFLHSALCCWVAVDRAMNIARDRSFPADLDRWRQGRDEMYREIHDKFWNEEKEAFTQFPGSDTLDASALLLPLLRFISAKEPRWEKTLDAIERELAADVLIFRYRQNGDEVDGIDGEESTFTICSFWYVECLARMGRLNEAQLAFEKLLSYGNHLGLFSEEISMAGEQLGNFPQAFSHLSLISAAFQIEKKLQNQEDYWVR
ncbi:glycoside hydrolase family 15 protein [Lewinella sp. W8]|uniref:glycoside hydrolase family 15 protein n=1 Tax=Lewinella sp. W8 TaxID=2528208 RepID=UPI001067CB52|nr:glycoside hydrolase family 15 protein [Lewinella sp. W8]MTB53418.1 glycoside hydrolase family 15 protein [Lewinella sp. W8]